MVVDIDVENMYSSEKKKKPKITQHMSLSQKEIHVLSLVFQLLC